MPLQRRSTPHGPGRLDAPSLRQPSCHSPKTCIGRGLQTGAFPFWSEGYTAGWTTPVGVDQPIKQGRDDQTRPLRLPLKAHRPSTTIGGCPQSRPTAQNLVRPRGLRVHLLGLDEGVRTLQTHRVTPHPGTVHLRRVRAVRRLHKITAGDGIAGRGLSREGNRATPFNLESTRRRAPPKNDIARGRTDLRSAASRPRHSRRWSHEHGFAIAGGAVLV